MQHDDPASRSEAFADALTSTDWQAVLDSPRAKARRLSLRSVPKDPGIYAWFRGEDCVYLGKAADLRSRLRTHLATGLDLSRSTFRSWVAVRELGLAREYTRRRPSQMTIEQVAAVSDWISACDLTWSVTASREEAGALEARLLAAWRPPINAA